MEADHVQDATADAFSCVGIAAADDRSPKAVIGMQMDSRSESKER
jgi:hypothetical protein